MAKNKPVKTKAADNSKKISPAFRYLIELTGIYLFLLFVIYPLYYERGFSNIGDSKWHIFRIITYYAANSLFKIPTFALFALIGLIWHLVVLIREKKLKAFYVEKACAADVFGLLFGIFTVISCIITPYRKYMILGFPTWYMGLLSQLAFVMIYFFVSYYWRWNKNSFILYLLAAGFIFATGYLNRFSIDILSIYTGVESEAKDFVSTIGQRTMYSGYVLTIFPLGAYIYWQTENIKTKIAALVFMVIGFGTIITMDADSAFLGLIGMYLVLFWFSFDSNKHMRNFLEIVLVMLLTWRITGFLQIAFPEKARAVGSIPKFCSQNKLMWFLIAFVAVFYVLVLVATKKEWKRDVSAFKIIRVLVLVLFFAGVGAGVTYIYLNTKGLLPESLSYGKDAVAQENYLIFNNYWGNFRGIDWILTFKTFFTVLKDDFPRFLFGAGPDEFYEMVYHYFGDELKAFYGDKILICSHNEWLNQFINGGLLGGIAYLGIFIAAFVRCARNSLKHPEMVAVLMCTASYFMHNIFCYQRITCTPFIFAIMAAGINIIRNGGMISISEDW